MRQGMSFANRTKSDVLHLNASQSSPTLACTVSESNAKAWMAAAVSCAVTLAVLCAAIVGLYIFYRRANRLPRCFAKRVNPVTSCTELSNEHSNPSYNLVHPPKISFVDLPALPPPDPMIADTLKADYSNYYEIPVLPRESTYDSISYEVPRDPQQSRLPALQRSDSVNGHEEWVLEILEKFGFRTAT